MNHLRASNTNVFFWDRAEHAFLFVLFPAYKGSTLARFFFHSLNKHQLSNYSVLGSCSQLSIYCGSGPILDRTGLPLQNLHSRKN